MSLLWLRYNYKMKNSQLSIYLTAKAAGEAEEDTGMLPFEKWRMGFHLSGFAFGVKQLGQLMEFLIPVASFPRRTLQKWHGHDVSSVVISLKDKRLWAIYF